MGFQNNLFLYVRPLESSSVYVVINWHWEDLTTSSFNKWFSLHDIVHCHLFKKDQQFLKNKILWEIYINRWSRSTPLVGLSSEFLGFFVEQSLYAEMHKPLPADPELFPSLPEPFVSLPRDCCLSTAICSTEHTETVQKRVHFEHGQAFLFAISSQHFLFSPRGRHGWEARPTRQGGCVQTGF